MDAKRVLLIDDDVELLGQMSRAFSAAGYSVRGAPDGEAGMARFNAQPADLVVCDIVMPAREGVETILALRKRCPAVKILAISGGYRLGPVDFLHLARQLGADETLAKPFRLSQLVETADRLLQVGAPA